MPAPLIADRARSAPHPRRRPLAILLVALAALVALMVAACGGSDGPLDTGDGESTEATEADGGRNRADPGDLPERPAAGEIAEITSAQGAALRASDRRVVFVDVRSLDEYLAGHLVGAQHIPLEDEQLWQRRTAALDPAHPTAVYCDTGVLSGAAAEALVALGFSEVYDLGGLDDWSAGDLPLDRKPT
jgi:phage shock protein E